MAEQATSGQGGDDWAARAVHQVDALVGVVRDHSLRPALTALRFVLLGLVCAGLGLVAAVLGVIGIVRLLTADAFGGRVWASDLLVGGLVTAAGSFLLLLSARVGGEDASA